jgi:hypothetical protein
MTCALSWTPPAPSLSPVASARASSSMTHGCRPRSKGPSSRCSVVPRCAGRPARPRAPPPSTWRRGGIPSRRPPRRSSGPTNSCCAASMRRRPPRRPRPPPARASPLRATVGGPCRSARNRECSCSATTPTPAGLPPTGTGRRWPRSGSMAGSRAGCSPQEQPPKCTRDTTPNGGTPRASSSGESPSLPCSSCGC